MWATGSPKFSTITLASLSQKITIRLDFRTFPTLCIQQPLSKVQEHLWQNPVLIFWSKLPVKALSLKNITASVNQWHRTTSLHLVGTTKYLGPAKHHCRPAENVPTRQCPSGTRHLKKNSSWQRCIWPRRGACPAGTVTRASYISGVTAIY